MALASNAVLASADGGAQRQGNGAFSDGAQHLDVDDDGNVDGIQLLLVLMASDALMVKMIPKMELQRKPCEPWARSPSASLAEESDGVRRLDNRGTSVLLASNASLIAENSLEEAE